jgi:hypothetical protein
MAHSIEQLSFELSASALAEQERSLAGLRTCAGTVLAAGSVAGSFLGARSSHGSLDGWGSVALVSFVLCVGSAVWVLLPHDFTFGFRAQRLLVPGERGASLDIGGAYRVAGAWIDRHLDTNRDKIAGLAACLTFSCTLLTLEIVAWILSLVG